MERTLEAAAPNADDLHERLEACIGLAAGGAGATRDSGEAGDTSGSDPLRVTRRTTVDAAFVAELRDVERELAAQHARVRAMLAAIGALDG